MKNSEKPLDLKLAIITFIIPVALQVTFLIYQIMHKVISIWNLIATAMIVGIFINAVRMNINDKKKQKEPPIHYEVTGGSTVDHFAKKTSKKPLIVKIIAMLVCVGLSILFFNIYNTKSNGLEIVNSRVVSQWGEKNVTTEETDEGITQTEEEYIEVFVEYEYNGIQKTAKLNSSTTDKLYVDELKIFVDKNGTCVCDYGRILVWKIEAIIFLISAIIFLLTIIFSLGIEFLAGTIFSLVGFGLFFLIGSQFIENILFNDIICFVSMFANVGIYMLLYGTLSLFSSKLSKNNTEPIEHSAHIMSTQPQKITPQTQIKTDLTCKNCGGKLLENDNFCQYCGTKVSED